MTDLASRLAAVKAKVATSARAAGRNPDDVRLIAVSKVQPLEMVVEAWHLGVRDFGENTAQSLKERADAFGERGLKPVRWHMIGALQRNKAKLVAPRAYAVHSVDRLELGEALAKRAPEHGLNVLIQVNVGREPQKSGVDPDEAGLLAESIRGLEGLHLRGLMAIPPAEGDPDAYFEQLKGLFDEMCDEGMGESFTELSMGMSGDYERAIAFGATQVRVGTAIFGDRPRKV